MNKHPMLINVGYPTRSYDAISSIAQRITGNVRIDYLKNGDIQASCDFELSEYEVYIISELSDHPWMQLATVSVLCETLKRRHVGRITLIVPRWNLVGMRSANYVGTARSDSSRTIMRILDGCGIDRIVTLTPTPLLRSPLFPIEVVRPDFRELFKSMLPAERIGLPLLIVEDPRMYVSAREFAYEGVFDLAVNHYADHRANITDDVRERDVLIYTETLENRHILLLEEEVLRRGARSCSIFAPVIDLSSAVMENLIERLRSSIHTFDTVLYGLDTDRKLRYLPVDKIIAEWIREDVEKRDLIVEERYS